MENKEKFDFIKQKLSENTGETPQSLSREEIVASLENVGGKKKSGSSLKRILSVAACFAFTAVAVFAAVKLVPDMRNSGTVSSGNTSAALLSEENAPEEENYDDIVRFFLEKKASQNELDGDVSGDVSGVKTKEYGVVYDAEAVNAKSADSASKMYSNTNVQVSGIDEADIIKNDGEYIYFIHGKSVLIYRAADLKKMSAVKIKSEKDNFSVNDIYVYKNRLVVITTEYGASDGNETNGCSVSKFAGFYNAGARCFIYDTENKENPSLVFEQTQSGSYVTSRLNGNILFTVSYYHPAYMDDGEKYEENVIPSVNGKMIKRGDIFFKPEGDSLCYTVVSACNIEKNESVGTSYAYLGGYSDACYCTGDMLYISRRENLCERIKKEYSVSEDIIYTEIIGLSVSENEIKQVSSGIVKGIFIGQFAMDEYNGYFRCATTSFAGDEIFKRESNIYVLDSSLNTVGKIENLKENEEVKSVRFMGDTAYVVTFENTDPLFIIDLSNPNSPKKTGEVKLPGFSSYLHPVGENLIVGIGYGGDENGADASVIKVTLFDVSDKKNPKVRDSLIFKDAETETLYNFKAFVSFPEKNCIGIPLLHFRGSYSDKDTYYDEATDRSYLLISLDGGKLTEKNRFFHETDYTAYGCEDDEFIAEFFRGIYIGETLYTVSENRICTFDIESGKKLSEVKTGE